MATDAAVGFGLELARFSEHTTAKLKKTLPATANIKNPIDLIGDAREDRYTAALEAVFPAASMRMVFTELANEGLAPHQVKQVYIWGASELNVWVDIGSTLGLKIEALRQHKSQMGDWDPAEMITRWAFERADGQSMEYAEAFRRMVLVQENGSTPTEPEPGQDEVHDRP